MKYVGFLLMFLVSACSVQDERYYIEHPKAMQNALDSCPARAPESIGCDKLHDLANKMSILAMHLRESPQDFGKQILALQESIAKNSADLTKNSAQPKLQALLDRDKHDLTLRLAVVKWLESPEA